jgi:hypothetical protein
VDGEIPSAHRGEALADRTIELAKQEGLSPDQIAAEAIEFYVRLPSHAREAWRSFEGAEADDLLEEAAWAAGRALLNMRYDRAVATGLKNFKSPLPADASQQDIEDHAVKICRAR